MERCAVRDRSALANPSRKIELVSADEIRGAIRMVVEESYGIAPDDVPPAVCRLLGFSRMSEEMSSVIGRHRDEMLGDGVLVLQGLNLIVNPS
jgi:hypothetical protein